MKTSTFALVFGIAYLAVGLLGLIPAALTPPPIDAPPLRFTLLYGYEFGRFPVNVLLSGLHLVAGLWGIAVWSRASNATSFARSIAVVFGALALMGLLPILNTLFGLIPIHSGEVWLHGGTAAIAAYFGWRETAASRERRNRAERRQRMLPVARERRYGLADRREGLAGMSPA
jgi:hypothetical protein